MRRDGRLRQSDREIGITSEISNHGAQPLRAHQPDNGVDADVAVRTHGRGHTAGCSLRDSRPIGIGFDTRMASHGRPKKRSVR